MCGHAFSHPTSRTTDRGRGSSGGRRHRLGSHPRVTLRERGGARAGGCERGRTDQSQDEQDCRPGAGWGDTQSPRSRAGGRSGSRTQMRTACLASTRRHTLSVRRSRSETGRPVSWSARGRLGGQRARRDRLADRPADEHARCNRSMSETAPVGIAYAAGSIWVANTGDGTITKIDADSGRPTRTLPIAATELAFGAGTLWASERRRTGWCASTRRRARSSQTIRSETVPRESPSAAARRGWRTAWTEPSRGSIRRRIRSQRVTPTGNGPVGDRRRRRPASG